jgi:peptidoglycan/xylan/chitin deacetylase (PgdA/CDA1 family)
MSSALRFIVAAAVLVPFACSSDEDGGGAPSAPPFTGPLTMVPAVPSGGASAEPGGIETPEPVGAGGSPSAEEPPDDIPLEPGATPVGVDDPNGVGGAPAAAGGAPAATGGTPSEVAGAGSGGTGGAPIPASPTSDLPVPPGAGVPPPAGTPGNLRVLPWAGFRGAVTYTLDDADDTQVQNYDALNALGVPMTFYLWTDRNGAMSNVWSRAAADGHELGNHTNSHQAGTSPNLANDTDTATTFIEGRFGVTVYTMAAPFGDAQYGQVAQSRFLINRGVGGGQIAPNGNTDRFNLPTFIPNPNAPASDFNSRVDTARAQGLWETVLVHSFIPGTGFQPVALAQFSAAVNYAKGLGDVWIDTMVDVGAYWIAGRMLTQATPTTQADTSTWTWTLPDHFPPDQFLRVTVDGGTLSQAGVPLTWDEHGYYEVSLDVGSLSLAP